MTAIDTTKANSIVQENLKYNKNRTFNETGIHFDGDIWAFPNNRKIFIGINDFAMDDRTFLAVKRAIFRHDFAQKLKYNRAVALCGLMLLSGAVLFGVQTCKSRRNYTEKNKQTCVLNKTSKPSILARFARNYSR